MDVDEHRDRIRYVEVRIPLFRFPLHKLFRFSMSCVWVVLLLLVRRDHKNHEGGREEKGKEKKEGSS